VILKLIFLLNEDYLQDTRIVTDPTLPIEEALHAVGDLIARAFVDSSGALHLAQAEPFPVSLQTAIRTVARDFGLPKSWMNAEVGAQWAHGLPPWILEDLTWRSYGDLDVGLVGRRTLTALKLFAAVDSGPRSVHLQDLLSIAPTDAELEESRRWVVTQDANEGFPSMIDEVIEYVRGHRS
jgi:hypothetical protein